MNLPALKAAVTSKAARQLLLAKKHSPRTMFIAGTVGIVGATVLACRATLKLDGVLETHDKKLANLGKIETNSAYGQDEAALDISKDVTKLKIKTGLEIAKLYAPAVGLGAVSIAALTGSHVVLSKRNSAVMAAYAGLDKAYKQYRKRVTEEYGEEVDRNFATSREYVDIAEKTAEGDIKVKKGIDDYKKGKNPGSPYTLLFDEKSGRFSREPGANPMTISMLQQWANDKLRSQGHLFLNEVHDMLQVPRTKAGSIVGWVWPKGDEQAGDGYVSFGVFDGDPERAEAFIDGDEKSIWLDFNVDGVIYDQI